MKQKIIKDTFLPKFSDEVEKALREGWIVKSIMVDQYYCWAFLEAR